MNSYTLLSRKQSCSIAGLHLYSAAELSIRIHVFGCALCDDLVSAGSTPVSYERIPYCVELSLGSSDRVGSAFLALGLQILTVRAGYR